jgi:hypothetical protein
MMNLPQPGLLVGGGGINLRGKETVTFLWPKQTSDLIALAERARQRLGTLAGHEVAYAVEAMQLLDEWIDDCLERAIDPSTEVRLLWASLLGEMF